MALISDSPKTHKFISARERDYLIRETVKEVSAKENGSLVLELELDYYTVYCFNALMFIF